MAYRSTVAIALHNDVIKDIPEEAKYVLNAFWPNGPTHIKENYVVYFHDYIKWFDNEDDFIEDRQGRECYPAKLWNWMVSLDTELYGFYRYGEYDGDYDSSGQWYDYGIEPIRTIRIE